MSANPRIADYTIHPQFIERWSPRAFTGEPIAEETLLGFFEAARWAPSAYNSQPWRFLYARRDTEHWPLFFDLLNEGNKTWCHRAAALIVFIFELLQAAQATAVAQRLPLLRIELIEGLAYPEGFDFGGHGVRGVGSGGA